MKKPTLRFRQVFEHPTHFKVVKPLGNPMLIAKKGLSPGLQNRLRKFAEGGEVTNPATDPSGEVVESVPPPVASPVAATDYAGNVVESIGPEVPQQSVAPIVATPVAAPVVPTAAPSSELEISEVAKTPQPIQVAAKPISGIPQLAVQQMSESEKAKERAKAEALVAADARERQAIAEAQSKAAEVSEREAAILSADVAKYNDLAEQNRDIAVKADKDLAEMKNIGSYFSRLDTGSKIGTAISLAMGAFATGISGVPNVALRLYEDAVDKDIEKQKRDANSLYQRLVQAGNSAQHAEEVVRSISARAAAARLDAAGARVQSAKAQQGAAAAAAAFREDADNRIRNIEKDNLNKAAQMYQLRMAGEQLKMAKVRQDVAQLLDAQRLMVDEAKVQASIAKETREAAEKAAANTFQVGPVGVKTSDPAQKRKAQEQILGQSDFVAGAEAALDLLKEKPFESYVPFTKAKQQAKLALKQMLERYPKAERFGRPLNVTASKVIASGLPDVDDIVGGVLGDPAVVVQQLVDDAKEQRRRAIEYYGGGDQAGVESAMRYLEGQSGKPKKFGSGATD